MPMCFFFLIEVWLIYNVVLVSDVQQNDSVCVYIYTHTHAYTCMCLFFYRFFSTIGYYYWPCGMWDLNLPDQGSNLRFLQWKS